MTLKGIQSFSIILPLCEFNKDGEVKYQDRPGFYIPYVCSQEAISGGSFCKFHDKTYAEAFGTEVMQAFRNLVEEAIRKGEPLLCIGYILVGDVNFTNKEFKAQVSFNLATFTEKAYFCDATFTEKADFSSAIFMGDADFSKATFTKDANFTSANFTKEAEGQHTSLVLLS